MVIVSDTTTISNLFLIGRLDILERLYGEIWIPRAVMNELNRLLEFGWDISSIQNASWIQVKEVQDTGMMLLLSDVLDQGEAEAIILAFESNADWLIIDELKGRRYAQKLNLNIIGLLGVLLEAKNQGIVDFVADVLEALKLNAKLWIHSDLHNKILHLANEIERI